MIKSSRSLFFAFIVGLISSVIVLGAYRAQAQTSNLTAEREAQLKAELQQVLNEIADQQKILDQEKNKAASYSRDIAILNAKIKEAQLNIKARNLAIQALGKDINAKTETINVLSGKIDMNRSSLAELIRQTNELDEYTLADVVLSNDNLSDYFTELDNYDTLKASVQTSLGIIKQNKTDTEVAKQTLDKKRLEEIDARISIEDEKAKIEKSEKEKQRLLSLSKEQQKAYQGEITKKQARAAQIRSALFALRDSAAIPFGDAYQFALEASKATGVRPAFLLAILTQESNLGANVGSCLLTDKTTGAGVKVSTGKAVSNVMKPSRDVGPFMEITAAIGRDPFQTRVSCPFDVGYGGAMGPSQFIPSTWKLFQSRIASAVGKSTPDPWEPRDAFMASAIYLGDLGASSQSYSAERNAACRYYSGRACDSKKPANAFYGDQVMSKASSIQTNMIDPLNDV